jgi:predicted GNAT family acetyltransferase
MSASGNAHIQNVYVKPTFRRRGIGQAMIEALINELQKMNINRLSLHATDKGKLLFQKCGFGYANSSRVECYLHARTGLIQRKTPQKVNFCGVLLAQLGFGSAQSVKSVTAAVFRSQISSNTQIHPPHGA